MKNLAHSASFQSFDKDAPSKPGTKHLDRDRASFVEPGFQGCEQSVCGSVVEAPFAFLEVEGELRFWDAIVAAQVAFGLAPEVLDAVDMVSPLGEKLAMVDAHVAELGHVEHVVGLETVAIDHGIGLNARPDDREERCRSNVWDDHRMHLAAPLEQSEDGNLAGSAAPPFALSVPAEIALIDLHLAAKQLGRFLIQALSDYFPQFAEE